MAECEKSTRQETPAPDLKQESSMIESESKPQDMETSESEQEETAEKETELATATMRRVAFCPALNLRSAPGIKSAILCVLPKGTQVVIDPLEWVADGTAVWFPAVVDAFSGYVNGQYLASED